MRNKTIIRLACKTDICFTKTEIILRFCVISFYDAIPVYWTFKTYEEALDSIPAARKKQIKSMIGLHT